MKAKVMRIEELFEMSDKTFFQEGYRKISIPKYQREYKWTNETVKELLSDIHNRDKFLGIITLDKRDNKYEIVDGQQRLTTLTLLLVAIFNSFKTEEILVNYNQNDILSKLINNGQFIIENHSIGGTFLSHDSNTKKIEIVIQNDIYEQKEKFESISLLINQYISAELSEKEIISETKLEEFLKKIMDCTILVLVNEDANNVSTEEVYVDINHKAQRLDVEDIFKGYCFKKVKRKYHNELRDKWVVLKKNGFFFKRQLGYDDFSNFLYIYFLNEEGNPDITEQLEISGKHVLYDKSMTQVINLNNRIEKYGTCIKTFYKTLSNIDDKFDKYLRDYNNQIDRINQIKFFCKRIMKHPDKYQKLPFFAFINHLERLNGANNKITLDLLSRVVTLYYVYSVIFSRIIVQKRSKKIILFDHIKIIRNLRIDDQDDSIKQIKKDIKKCCKNILEKDEHFQIKKKFDYNASIGLYSILDNYDKDNERIEILYSSKNNYNDEHFIIHEKNKIFWGNAQNNFAFKTSDYSKYKGYTGNRLILPKSLNEINGNQDIISKIDGIKNYYSTEGIDIPKHITIFIEHVENMNSYNELKKLKTKGCVKEDIIKDKYFNFIKEYFGEELSNHDNLLKKLFTDFCNVLLNN